RTGRRIAPAPDLDDDAVHATRLHAARDRDRRRQRGARTDGDHGDRRPARFDAADARRDPGRLHVAGPPQRRGIPRARRAQAKGHRRRCRGPASGGSRMTLAELSLKRPVTVIMVFVSMTVIGLIAAFRLPLESMRDIQFPFMEIVLPYQGSTPAEVERTVTRPVEEALSTLTGIQRMH